MNDQETTIEDSKSKRSKLPLILAILFAIIGGSGGFYLSWSSLVLGESEFIALDAAQPNPGDDVVYIPIDPLVISLPQPARSSHLRFRAQLEVRSEFEAEVQKLLPRVTDVLNGYLRAISVEDLESQTILLRLRAQMLHRVDLVVGAERVNNILIMEFVFT